MGAHTPKTADELAAVLRNREGPWEYLVFACVLWLEREKHMDAYRDDRLRFAPATGEDLDFERGWQRIGNAMGEAQAFAETINELFRTETLEAAMGAPGEPGDADLIVHLSTRIIDNWRSFIDWARALRGARVPSELRPVFRTTADLSRAGIGQVYDWVDEVVTSVDHAVDLLESRHPKPIRMELVLTVTVDDEDLRRHEAAIADLERQFRLG